MSNTALTTQLETTAILPNTSPLSDPLASVSTSRSSVAEPPNVTGTTLNRLFKLFGNPVGGVQAFLEANELSGHVLIADAGATDEVTDTDGLLSLREAVNIANMDGMMSTIVLEPGTYQLTLQGVGENNNATGDLDISDSPEDPEPQASLNIISAGGSTIDATNLGDRVFHNIGSQHGWGGDLYLKNVTVIGGTADFGGAIASYGTLNITGSTFTNNSAFMGGAIYNDGPLNVTGSTFTYNSAQYDGGAIYNYFGPVTVTDSTFTYNSAQYDGGAIYNYFYLLNVTGSTFTYNSAQFKGGAIYGSYEAPVHEVGNNFSNNTPDNIYIRDF